VLSRIGHLAQAILLLGTAGAPLGNMGEADDGVHRRPDFMTDIGQEGTLGPACRFGLVLGPDKLLGAVGDQRFEMLAIVFQFGLGLLFLGNVFLDTEIVGDHSILLAHRGDDGEFGEDRPILPLVDELAAPSLSLAQRCPQIEIGFIGRLLGVQQARLYADDFFAAVAGIADESVVDVFDLGIGVGNDDAVRTLLNGQRQLAQLFLGEMALGHILHRADGENGLT